MHVCAHFYANIYVKYTANAVFMQAHTTPRILEEPAPPSRLHRSSLSEAASTLYAYACMHARSSMQVHVHTESAGACDAEGGVLRGGQETIRS